MKDGAMSRFAIDRNRAGVLFHNSVYCRQAKTGAAVVLLCREEWLKDMFHRRIVNAVSGV